VAELIAGIRFNPLCPLAVNGVASEHHRLFEGPHWASV
jgi:hypothetical protein